MKWRKSDYGCKYRIGPINAYLKGVELTFWDRFRLMLGAQLYIVHHYQPPRYKNHRLWQDPITDH